MMSSGKLCPVALVSTDVWEELRASFIRVTRIGELGTTLAVFLRSVHRLLVRASVFPSSPILVTLMNETLNSSETSVRTRATRRNISEDTILLLRFPSALIMLLIRPQSTSGIFYDLQHLVTVLLASSQTSNEV
jgi:hypothetical protein